MKDREREQHPFELPRGISSMSVIGLRATPVAVAASATAGAHHRSTRVSNGFGMR